VSTTSAWLILELDKLFFEIKVKLQSFSEEIKVARISLLASNFTGDENNVELLFSN